MPLVSLLRPSRRVTAQTPKTLEQSHTICKKQLYIIEKVAARMILGPGRNWLCDHGASSECATSSVHHELHAVRANKSKV